MTRIQAGTTADVWLTLLEAIQRQRARWEARREEVVRRLTAIRKEHIALMDHLRSIEAHCDASALAEKAARELDRSAPADSGSRGGASGEG